MNDVAPLIVQITIVLIYGGMGLCIFMLIQNILKYNKIKSVWNMQDSIRKDVIKIAKALREDGGAVEALWNTGGACKVCTLFESTYTVIHSAPYVIFGFEGNEVIAPDDKFDTDLEGVDQLWKDLHSIVRSLDWISTTYNIKADPTKVKEMYEYVGSLKKLVGLEAE